MANESAKRVAHAAVDTIASSTTNVAVSITTVASTSTTTTTAADATTAIAISPAAGVKGRHRKPQPPSQKRQVLLFI